MLNTPDYYNSCIEVIDFIEAYNLNFSLGNVVKYICRAGNKPGEARITALNKALNYLEHEIRAEEKSLQEKYSEYHLPVLEELSRNG